MTTGGPEALPQEPPAQDAGAALRDVPRLLNKLLDRVRELEDAVAENTEHLVHIRKQVSELKHVAARKKQLKKLKKLIDQLEVVEEDEDEAPQSMDEGEEN